MRCDSTPCARATSQRRIELELLRDANDNVVIICTVENFDPMGVHTGDSITVAPAMTLSDTAFQLMRNTAIMMMRDLGNIENEEHRQVISDITRLLAGR